ncbi:hypothetical protein [Mycobacteroides abscessus]|uniref:hypothetical protein n=1 Tax=Mycobacteroides abscessus TaxID=36809 RepID=UPI000D6A7CB5|nr:hypothetical protein [Mycobacteroides abscessus]
MKSGIAFGLSELAQAFLAEAKAFPSGPQATIDINGVIATYPPALNPQIEAILNALHTENPRH